MVDCEVALLSKQAHSVNIHQISLPRGPCRPFTLKNFYMIDPLELTGSLLRRLSKKTDKNGHDYYLGKLNCNNGMQYVFFFFQPDYDLSIRLADLTIYDEITLQGY
jgi:hypothetical protein